MSAIGLVGIAILSLVGCSGGGGSEGAEVAVAERSPAEAPGKTLNVQELKSLTFTAGEVPGVRDVASVTPFSVSEPTHPPVSVAACRSVVYPLRASGLSAAVNQNFNWENFSGGDVTLASYENDGAERVFRRLREELKECESFSSFSAEVYGKKNTFEVKMEDAPNVGDEALRFRANIKIEMGEGEGGDLLSNREYIFVWVGRTVVVFDKMEYEERKRNFRLTPSRSWLIA
ncbi:hypothetical protein [Streptomyces dysideae]|uniref:hypothetical protein n=1 Tax=Streptomyces dysideae TaxID=909626 RepID=UPI00131A8C28|nr:hypothetical protein [Streptomyces dysideae]